MKKYPEASVDPNEIRDIFVSMTSLLFNQLPIPINFIDTEGKVIIMNQAFLDYLNIGLEDVTGKHLSEIDPSVRLPIVVKTGHAEIGQKHRFHSGRESIVHRIPLFYKDTIIGGVGIILIEDLNYLYEISEENSLIKTLKVNKANKIADVYKTKYTFDDILTQSYLGEKCKEQAKIYSTNDFPILITGESGVGKELFAHSIHSLSNRKDGPFIRVNCAAIPESLIESELFGYEKGAFTGAQSTGKIGKFELANGGTIFLDEIGDFPLGLQAKLLRVLQEKEIEKIGSNEIVQLDIRIIAATNYSLEDKVKENKFRQDLFYRLNVLNLNVPSLKERKDDIPLLINHFITSMYQNFNIYKRFPDDVIEILKAYSWPGNVRELKNIVERIAVNTKGKVVNESDIPDYIIEEINNNFHTSNEDSCELKNGSLKNTLLEIEKRIIKDTLLKCNNNKTEAARVLGIPRMTLYRKLKEFDD